MPTAEAAGERMAIRAVVLCGLIVVLEGYDLSALGYVVPAIAEEWQLGPAAFTSALTGGNVGMLFGALLCGWLGDRVGRKPMLLACVAIFGAASLLTAFVGSPAGIAVARLITGFGLGGGIPLCVALVSDLSPKHRQGAMVIIMISGVVVGNLLAGIIAAYLLAPFGWPSIFVVGGVLPLLVLPILYVWLPESPAVLAARASGTTSLGSAVGPGGNRLAALFAPGLAVATALLWAISYLNLLTIYFVNSWLPSMLRSMGASNESAIIATSMFHVGAIVAAFVSGSLVGRFGIERVLTIMLAIGATCIVLAGVLDLSVFALGALILGFGFGTNGSQLGISALPGAIYAPLIRSTGAGWTTGVGRVGNISGALAGGVLLSLGWSAQQMLLMLALAPAINAILMAALGRARASAAAASLRPAPSIG